MNKTKFIKPGALRAPAPKEKGEPAPNKGPSHKSMRDKLYGKEQ